MRYSIFRWCYQITWNKWKISSQMKYHLIQKKNNFFLLLKQLLLKNWVGRTISFIWIGINVVILNLITILGFYILKINYLYRIYKTCSFHLITLLANLFRKKKKKRRKTIFTPKFVFIHFSFLRTLLLFFLFCFH